MTSSGVCINCQGELHLYEEHWTEFGREWVKFEGRCPNCNCLNTEYPHGFYEQYEEAEKEFKAKQLEEMAKSMTDEELFEKLGSYDYPYYEGKSVYTEDKREVVRSVTLEDCIAQTIPLSLKHLRSDIVIMRFGRELLRMTSDEIKEQGWYNYEVDVFWRVYRRNREDYDELYRTYSCRTIEEVENRIRQHHSDKWRVYIVGKFEVSSQRYGDRMSPEMLHSLLEVLA